MMDINVGLLQWPIKFLIKKFMVEQLKTKIFLINNEQKNFTNQLLKSRRKEK